MALYGNVEQKGDLFCGKSASDNIVYWDGKGRRYYDTIPEFERVGNLDMIRVDNGKYILRRPSSLMPYAVRKKAIFYNDQLTIIGDIIILNNENSTVLKPIWYFGDRMLIEARRDGKKAYRLVTLSEGLTDEYSSNFSNGSSSPCWEDAQMINAATGKMEYLNPEWVKQQRWGQLSNKRNQSAHHQTYDTRVYR